MICTDGIAGTRVNREKLKQYCDELPGCSIFLENFFTTCGDYSPGVNFLNYIQDLDIYSRTNMHIRDNFRKLENAFFDIIEV